METPPGLTLGPKSAPCPSWGRHRWLETPGGDAFCRPDFFDPSDRESGRVFGLVSDAVEVGQLVLGEGERSAGHVLVQMDDG